ncbi:isochorismatase family protein [Streptomyces sp. NBC_01218]|uniref:isochorismatase family protein n=1 Tax=unclassified Streptomyces TaxID=2593676 RepID=UPI0023B90FF7|nr:MULTISPECIES: isochorismatase family protein [unclassified Streptomyces]WEH39149.1 isochorismatase family protein [Streptomyces sp. AM 2-1-1]WSQ50806.1 isochorismatase family protein [Streptomyces sp. NBC_01218]
MVGIPAIAPYELPTPGSLPANLADWTPDPDRAALVVHDMQRFFLRPFPDPLRSGLVHHAAQLRKRAASLGVPVAYSAQPGGMTAEERGLLADFWGPGMRTSPEDREVVDELAPADGDWLLTKRRYSAFFRSDLLERLRDSGRDQLVLCGVYAHIGVLATAIDAFSHDIQVFLAADAVADFTLRQHEFALEYVAQRCGVVVLSDQVFT